MKLQNMYASLMHIHQQIYIPKRQVTSALRSSFLHYPANRQAFQDAVDEIAGDRASLDANGICEAFKAYLRGVGEVPRVNVNSLI